MTNHKKNRFAMQGGFSVIFALRRVVLLCRYIVLRTVILTFGQLMGEYNITETARFQYNYFAEIILLLMLDKNITNNVRPQIHIGYSDESDVEGKGRFEFTKNVGFRFYRKVLPCDSITNMIKLIVKTTF